ncbi:hypothetical protein AHAS_Ahas02G0102700 [Arachis hypogaea]
MTGTTIINHETMEAECLHQFRIVPKTNDCKGSYIKMIWNKNLKDRLHLNDRVTIKKYVKCDILLFGSILFADKFESAALGVSMARPSPKIRPSPEHFRG